MHHDAPCCRCCCCRPRRNVTITGLPGQAMPLWNLRFQRASVELCAGCAFTLDSIAIANERRGNGAAVDLFVGAQGARSMRRCTRAAAAAAAASQMYCMLAALALPGQQPVQQSRVPA